MGMSHVPRAQRKEKKSRVFTWLESCFPLHLHQATCCEPEGCIAPRCTECIHTYIYTSTRTAHDMYTRTHTHTQSTSHTYTSTKTSARHIYIYIYIYIYKNTVTLHDMLHALLQELCGIGIVLAQNMLGELVVLSMNEGGPAARSNCKYTHTHTHAFVLRPHDATPHPLFFQFVTNTIQRTSRARASLRAPSLPKQLAA
jgi:hypothetical protein